MSQNIRNSQLTGIWTAIVTPFKLDGQRKVLDLDAFKMLIRLQVEAGVSGIIPCGTTGESPTLSLNEKKLLIKTAIEELKEEKVNVVAGTGSNNTQASIDLSRWASDEGADGVLLVCPYYNRPTQRGLIEHFTAIADAVKCEVVLYNVPVRTGVSLTPQTISHLAKHVKITSLKEASGDMGFLGEVQEELKSQSLSLNLLSGDDSSFLDFLKNGGHGVVSVGSNLIPQTFVKIYSSFVAGDQSTAESLNEKYAELFRGLSIEPNPIPLKRALGHVGLCNDLVRLPLTAMSPENAEQLIKRLDAVQLKTCSQKNIGTSKTSVSSVNPAVRSTSRPFIKDPILG